MAFCWSLEALRFFFERFEIIIVDDASTDETGKIADALAAEHAEIKVIHNPQNIGQGASILVGFQHATGNLLIHNAIDYPFDLRDLNKMLPLLEEADIVVAVRQRDPDLSDRRSMILQNTADSSPSLQNSKTLSPLYTIPQTRPSMRTLDP